MPCSCHEELIAAPWRGHGISSMRRSDPRMVEYVQKLDSSMVKRVVLVTSCASRRNKQDMIRNVLLRNGIQVAPDEFICRGNFLFLGAGHPNRRDIDDAISFVRKVTK